MTDIVDEIDRETKIINDLLALVKTDKKNVVMNFSMVNINQQIDVIMRRVTPLAQARGIELTYESFREVIAEVDEVDLGRIRVGTICPILLDMDEETVLQGQVTEISSLGITRQNAAWYQVHLSLENASQLPLGASASVYLPK